MAWSDYEIETHNSDKVVQKPKRNNDNDDVLFVGAKTQHAKDRSFVHGIIIGGIISAIVFGVTFGLTYGQLAQACSVS